MSRKRSTEQKYEHNIIHLSLVLDKNKVRVYTLFRLADCET